MPRVPSPLRSARRHPDNAHRRGDTALTRATVFYVAAAAASLVTAAGPSHARAQAQSDAALYLVLPVGARATGQGHTLVAEEPGSEAIWWNPAGIARQRDVELAIHHSQTVAGNGDAISLVIPSRKRGVLAVSVNILNLGNQQVVEDPNQPPVGLILPRNVIYALTYAIGPGHRLSAGATYKVSQLRVDCTGQCASLPPSSETIRAFDAGVQYRLGPRVPLTLGVALRNQQPDDRARQIEIGGTYELGFIKGYVNDVAMHVATAMMFSSTPRSSGTFAAPGDPGYDRNVDLRVGVVGVYQDRVYLRAGYIGGEGDATGPALGFGVLAGRLAFDLARAFDGLSADAGQPPTFFSLRFVF